MRLIDADALKELFSEVIGSIAKKPEMNGNLEHMIRASAMVIQMIDDAPTVQPETNCSEIPNNSDTISRQAALEKIRKMQTYKMFAGDDLILVDQAEAQTELMMLPSVQPERNKGEWIYGEDDGQDGWYCSECNGFVPWDYEYYGLENIDFIDDFKVCPFCEADMISRTGADMRGEQNDNR